MILGPALPLTRLGSLGLAGGGHLAAGSGLTWAEGELRVVADDMLEVGVFRGPEARLERLLDRPPLPADESERKRLKPDLESATLAGGIWLALGSGSTPARMAGVCASQGQPREFDLRPLYEHLGAHFPELNVEGLAPTGDLLRLAQRGNGSQGCNALIDLDLRGCLAAATAGASWGPELIRAIRPLELGSLDGVPLTVTDLAPLDGQRCLFTAAAEDTSNTYDDGAIKGSAVGVLEADGRVAWLRPVDQVVKLEGITVGPQGQVLVVTDNDDPEVAASLWSVGV